MVIAADGSAAKAGLGPKKANEDEDHKVLELQPIQISHDKSSENNIELPERLTYNYKDYVSLKI